MQWSSLPPRTPSWLLRQPLLLAEWIAARNRIARARPHAAAIAVVSVVAIGALAVVLLTAGSRLPALLDGLLNYRVLTMLVAAMFAAFTVARRVRHTAERYAKSWLIAAPIRPLSRGFALLSVSIAPLILQLLAVSMLLAIAGAVAGVAASTVLELIAWIAVAAVVGAMIGGWSARRPHMAAMEGSRYAATPRQSSTAPSLAALSGWPLAQVRVWGRPDNSRMLVAAAALFGVMSGSSAAHGLSVIAIWLLGGYLVGLLNAVLHVAREAALWLRSTPISFAKFAWAVARRALLHQVVATVLAAGLIMVLGAPPLFALYLAALWLTIVGLACSIGLADSYRARLPFFKIAVSFATLATVEAREQGWSIPIAVLIAVWQLRAGARA
jgi:hypothetical protein